MNATTNAVTNGSPNTDAAGNILTFANDVYDSGRWSPHATSSVALGYDRIRGSGAGESGFCDVT